MDLPARYQQIDLALVLGSGLGPLAELLTDQTDLAIPGWKKPSVKGHHGRVVVGLLGTVKTIAIVGRIHYYEGHGVNQTVLPISLFKTLGVSTVILTNASGGLNSSYRPGDLAVIKDHVSFAGLAGVNPLIGNPAMPQGFPAVADAYDYQLRLKACTAAQKLDIAVHESVYCFVAGPSFETRAEARFLRSAGCDLVGMSTVPEVIASVALGMRVLALSLVTNNVILLT